MKQKIIPYLWFDNNAEEAVNFYCSVFKDSKILSVSRYTEAGPIPAGTVLVMDFELNGQRFTALNGGPEFPFTHAVSFLVDCVDQAEVDYYWDKLSAGGAEEMCGWLRDKFGVSWQVVPNVLGKLLSDPDPAKVLRVSQAFLQMKKFDIAGLMRAYEQA